MNDRRPATGDRLTVALIGATGLVGGECLRLLLAEPGIERVTVLARKAAPAGTSAPKLDWRVADLERLDAVADALAVDAVVCALGTTIKQAGSQARFRAVDHDIPLAAARIALAKGARHYLLVSALGAGARSRIFYNRVKGELEDALIAMGWQSLTIVRPSLLLGDRGEFRLGEEIAKRLAWAMPRRWAPNHARDVAATLVAALREPPTGVHLVESSHIARSPVAGGRSPV